MPTYYVEDYDGKRNDDAVAPVVLSPVVSDGNSSAVEAKVVEPESKPRTAKKTSRAQTKKK